MTPGDLARVADIRARADAATGDAWGWRHFGDDPEMLCRIVYYPIDPKQQWEVLADEIGLEADAEFIAAARADVPWLLDRLAAETERADVAEAASKRVRARTRRATLEEAIQATYGIEPKSLSGRRNPLLDAGYAQCKEEVRRAIHALNEATG